LELVSQPTEQKLVPPQNPKKRKAPSNSEAPTCLKRGLRSSKRLRELGIPHIIEELELRREARHKEKLETKEKQRRQRVRKSRMHQYKSLACTEFLSNEFLPEQLP
jgi:hypothetical protein